MNYLYEMLIAIPMLSAVLLTPDGAGSQELDPVEKRFIDTVYDDENVSHYVTLIDSVTVHALGRIYGSLSEMAKDDDIGKVKTTNGVLMVYTVRERNGEFEHQVSVSRRPYLASTLGTMFVSLFAQRTGLEVPEQVFWTQNGVFHAFWTLSAQQQVELVGQLEARRDVEPEEAFTAAMLATGSIRLERVELDPDAAKKALDEATRDE